MAYVGARTLFAVFGASDPTVLGKSISDMFGADVFPVPGHSAWLIVADGLTAKDVADRLGITDGKAGTAIVITSGGYFGRFGNNVWEWIVARMGTRPA